MTRDELRASTANFLTVSQVVESTADLDGNTLDERTVRRACKDGQIPSVVIGRRVLIPRIAFLALIEEGTR